MVYEGRPSRGCATCKSRRIKCDETRPHCNKCTRANRECPGLPDEVDLIFRSENPARRRSRNPVRPDRKTSDDVDVVELKSLVDEYEQQKQRLNSHPNDLKSHRNESPKETEWQRHSLLSIVRASSSSDHDLSSQTTFNPSIEEQATVFFFNNFVLNRRSQETTRGFLEVAGPMFEASSPGSALHLAVHAVAVSVVANWPGRRHLAQKSQSLYGQALNAIQRDLETSKNRTSDATLLTVLMFSLYESITSSEHSVQAWARHIEGAVTLVKARGTRQFKDPQSLLLFRAVRTQMLTNAIQQKKRIPEFSWMGDIEDGDDSPAAVLLRSSMALPNFLAEVKIMLASEQTSTTISKVNTLLNQATEIQDQLSRWESQIPPEWSHKSVANVPDIGDLDRVEELEGWPGVIHTYQDVHVACVRNNNRVSQLLCSSVVIDCLKWLHPLNYNRDFRYTPAKSRVQALVDAICCTVPFHMYGSSITEGLQALGRVRNAGQAVGGYFLIWPIYVSSNMEDISDTQRRWIRGRLAHISRHYGLDQVNLLSSVNKGRPGANWSQESRSDEPLIGRLGASKRSDDGYSPPPASNTHQNQKDMPMSDSLEDVSIPENNDVLDDLQPGVGQKEEAKQQEEDYFGAWQTTIKPIATVSVNTLAQPADVLAEMAGSMDSIAATNIAKAAG